MKFVTINQPHCALTISYKDKCIEEAVNLKFLFTQIDNHLNWRNHIYQIIPKLSVACYMVRQMYHICNNDTHEINLFRLFSFCCELWNNSLGKFLIH